MRSFLRVFLFFCILLPSAFLTGCMTKNDVRLLYHPATAAMVPSAAAPRVAVVVFDDQRGKTEIGLRKDGSAFQPVSDVAQWVSAALAEELARKGMQVSLAESALQAEAGNPDCIVTGTVENVWLEEKGVSHYTASIRIQMHVNRGGNVTINKFSAQQDKSGMPGAKLAEGVLAGALTDVVESAVNTLSVSLRGH